MIAPHRPNLILRPWIMLTFASVETSKKRMTEDPVEVGISVETSGIPNLTYTAMSKGLLHATITRSDRLRHGPVTVGCSTQQRSRPFCSRTNFPRDRILGTSSLHALPRTGEMDGAPTVTAEPAERLPQKTHQARGDRSPFDSDVRGSPDQESGTSSLSASVHISRLERRGMKQQRPSTTWLAHRDRHSRYWWTSPRWAQTCASYPRATARAWERRTTTTIDGTDHTSALAPLLQRHGAHAADTFSRSSASQSSEACTAVRFAVRRRLSGWCLAGDLWCFLHSRHGFIPSTGVHKQTNVKASWLWMVL